MTTNTPESFESIAERSKMLADWLKSDEGQAELKKQVKRSRQTRKDLQDMRTIPWTLLYEPFDI